MKNFKVLFLLAALSTGLVASEGSADKGLTQYAQQGMNLLKSFGSYVSTKGSEFGDVVSKQASYYTQQATELAASGYKVAAQSAEQVATSVTDYAKTGMDCLSTGSTNMYANSVKFVQDNPKTVGVTTIVATAVAAAAIYRKLTLGYIFYKSQHAEQN